MTTDAIPFFDSPADLAARLDGRPFVSAELIYKPRPTEPRARRVFDFTLASRLTELSRYPNAAAVLICDSPASLDSLAHLSAEHPNLALFAVLANPVPLVARFADPYAETPFRCGWQHPEGWRRYTLTDRWARITCALDLVRQLPNPGYLVLPAHDAVWGQGLLARLATVSQHHAHNGQPAAVSPYTPHHHSAVPGVDIPGEIIDALNAAFSRDSLLRWRLTRGSYQAFWGKMGILPFSICGAVLDHAETFVWEDDLEIDRVIRKLGFGLHAAWVGSPALYRQALPVFDRAGLRAVIDRTLHYSLNIPGGASLLTRPLDPLTRLRIRLSPRFSRAVALSETLTAECRAEIATRLDRFGASWVDWGAYRYVVQVGDPQVQVWKYGDAML